MDLFAHSLTHSLHVQHMLERQREKEGEKKEREREGKRESEGRKGGEKEGGIVCVYVCNFSVRIFISACIYFTFQEVHVIVVIHAVYNSAEG